MCLCPNGSIVRDSSQGNWMSLTSTPYSVPRPSLDQPLFEAGPTMTLDDTMSVLIVMMRDLGKA